MTLFQSARPWATLAWGLLLVAVFSPVYAGCLDRAPISLVSDEGNFGSQAASLVATGRDLNGTRFPVFFLIPDVLAPERLSTTWYQPFLFYAVAASVSVFPIAEWSIRLPNAILALASIWLVFEIGRRLFGRTSSALIAALMLGIMPALVVISRRALDYVCPLPFALVWFLCVQIFRDSGQLRYMAIAGATLGVGAYSYIASWALMPMLLFLTPLALADTGHARRATLVAAGAFAVPMLPLAYWLIAHPETLETLVRYQLPVGQTTTMVDRLWSFDIAERVSLYWDYFNPSFLFFSGGSSLTAVGTGVLPLSMAVLLPVGLYHLVRRGSYPGWTLIAVAVLAPLPIVITLPDIPSFTIARALIGLPFLALIAAHGAERLMANPRPLARAAAALLLLAMAVQFSVFIRDYFTDYQRRSARLSDPMNTGAVAEALLARDAIEPISRIYLPSNHKGAGWIWKFLTLKHDRPDLWARTREFDPDRGEAQSVPPGSLLVILDPHPQTSPLLAEAGLSIAEAIRGVDGEPAALILRKDR